MCHCLQRGEVLSTVNAGWNDAGTNAADVNPAYGIQAHHPRFIEFIGAPKSTRLLNSSPAF